MVEVDLECSGRGLGTRMCTSAARVEACAERRPWANGRAGVEFARPAVLREMVVGNMRGMLAHDIDAAHDA